MNFFRVQFSVIVIVAFLTGIQAADKLFHENEELFEEFDSSSSDEYRLPTAIIPQSYEILLTPELKGNFTFTGIAKIKAIAQETTKSITLHCGRINVQTITIVKGNERLVISNTTHNEVTETCKIDVQKNIEKGENILIAITYAGVLNDNMIGFYRSSYVAANGEIKWLAATQFQATHARHAFPCFDEPGLKATFVISIQREAKYTCISNMPLESTRIADNTYWDIFKQSIPMSTYLVAFMISDFEYLGTESFKVWAKPNAIKQANYALSTGPKALDHLSNLFQQEYQISKMDMVAVPDFAAGAMENWGLVTYRESRLLYDENESSDTAKQSIAAVIVHELTHMWFGNMITPAWWSHLWLSEAFARYYQYFGTAKIETTWNMEDQFVVEQHQSALGVDGIESSQPMSRNVSTQSQIGGMGDSITYNKGASIVRMMNLLFGAEVFDAGLQDYLENNKKSGVGHPDHLWTAFQGQVDRHKIKLGGTVKEMMSTWTTQAGFPVVTVSIDKGIASLRQERFLLRNLKSTPTNVQWWVPITWTSKSNPDFDTINAKFWLRKKEDQMPIDDTSGWVIFNVQSSGFYRVNYDNNSWYRIINALNSKDYQAIHELNRAAIVDDLLNLARANLVNYETAFEGLRYLQSEVSYLPLKAALNGFTYLDRRFSGNDEYHSQFKKFILKLINDTYKDLGYVDRSNDDRLTILLRGELNNWACNFGHEGCVNYFKKAFQAWRKDNKLTIKPNQRAAAYCTGIRHGTKEDWEFLWNQYFKSNVATDQAIMIQALGCTTDTKIMEKYLLNAVSGFEKSRVRKQDSTTIFSAVSSSSLIGAEYIMDFVAKYHVEMAKYYGNLDTVASILSSASQRYSTQKLLEKYENFIKTHSEEFKSIESSLKNSLDLATYELQWYEKNSKVIGSWLIAFNEGTVPDDSNDTTDYRLPTTIIPMKYMVTVTPYIFVGNFTFKGVVDITANVAERTRKIVLHSSDITHHNVNVIKKNKIVKITDTSIVKKFDFLVINLAEDLLVGDSIVIQIEYTGNLNEEMRGFYRSSYLMNGERRWLAATHMEPVGARKMFPCFDEPALKATFVMKAIISQGYHAISNMPVKESTENADEQTEVTFQETPKMSTYLVALVVSDFASYKNDITPYAVWARPNGIDQAKYAHSVMEPLVKFYERAVGSPYQLPKLDMVALPDFASGAMENWGLLTYRERNMLFDEINSPAGVKQSVANVISHEISHQWFGNLVSPLWWKYLWLNEGFARYFQYFGTATVNPDWSLESQFVVDQLQSAFGADSLTSTHAMSHDVYSPVEIRSIFDSISYAKGASIVRMVEKVIGRETFYKALTNYLNKRKYDVATPEDLFDAFKEQINDVNLKNSIHAIMNTWTTQPGFPVVQVSIKDGAAHLQQERFIIRNKDDNIYDEIWHIPISWTSDKNPNYENTKPKYWLTEASGNVDLKDEDKDLLIFNVQQTGFYRVNYENTHWQKIIEYLKSSKYDTIHEINRASLIDDLMNLGRTGYVDYEIVFSATQYLINENSLIPWRAFFNGLNYLHTQFQGKDVFNAYKRYATALIAPIYKELGFEDRENDTHVTKLFRTLIRTWACELDVSTCETNALLYFYYWRKGDMKEIPANYRAVSYCAAVKQDTLPVWKLFWQLYADTTLPSEKQVILKALACTTNTYFLDDLLRKAITKDSHVRSQDSASVFSAVYDTTDTGVEYIMKFIQDNYDHMLTYYNDVSKIKGIISGLGKKLRSKEHHIKYNNLINWLVKKDPSLERSLSSFKSRADSERSWAEKYIPRIHEWMDRNYPDTQYRLPELYTPIKYNVSLSPYFEERNFTFDGRVQIEMEINELETSRIVLNTDELKIEKVSVYESKSDFVKGNELEVSSFMINDTTQTLSIYLKKFVKAEKIIVDVEFTGHLNEKMEGFYRSYYLDSNGNTRWLATTQFEPTFARRAFPCFDEPAYKANFIINIERPNEYNSLSNMPIDSSLSLRKGRTWDKYIKTVPMSSYLVAFVVSDFQRVNNYDKVNVWGNSEVIQYGEYAQIAGLRMLEYLEMETGFAYSLPKLDLIGIPDFSMGAMENWGLATFREYGLFYHKDVTNARYTDYILTIISHELAHMWYGNLVTCEWWEYIWLNEGFAEYLQWRIANLFRPSHRLNDLFVVHEAQVAMQTDAVWPSHPINNPVSTPSEIRKIFDGITYGKASSVIRMIRNSIEPRVFQKAMYQYIKNNQYGTTNPKDLWIEFDKAINETKAFGDWDISMETLMDNWTNKAGYPVVHAKLNGNKLTLEQERFLINRDIVTPVYYWVPITIASASKLDFITTWTDIWLGEKPLDIMVKDPNEWFLLNVQQSGFYRVNYDTDSWYRLIDALKSSNHNSIYVTNRAQIIDDLFNLARADYVHYNVTFVGTTYLANESEYPPWKAFFNGMTFLAQRYEGQKGSKDLATYITLLTQDFYKKLGFQDLPQESHFDQLSRELILNWVCKYDNKECVDTSLKLYNDWRSSSVNSISPNARPAVYCTALRNGPEAHWVYLWQEYLKTNHASEKKVMLDALGCTRDKSLLNRYIGYALNVSYTSPIRKQDVSAALASVYNSGETGVNTMLDYLIKHYQDIYKYYGNWDDVASLFSAVASRISTSPQIEKLETFFKENRENVEKISSKLDSAISTANSNYYWYKEHSRPIDRWLNHTIFDLENGSSNVIASGLTISLVTLTSIMMYLLN